MRENGKSLLDDFLSSEKDFRKREMVGHLAHLCHSVSVIVNVQVE